MRHLSIDHIPPLLLSLTEGDDRGGSGRGRPRSDAAVLGAMAASRRLSRLVSTMAGVPERLDRHERAFDELECVDDIRAELDELTAQLRGPAELGNAVADELRMQVDRLSVLVCSLRRPTDRGVW
jgi:hypothetical protein